MALRLSVVVCAHNPRIGVLREVLGALDAQTLPKDMWELVLVDNASDPPLADALAESMPANGRVVVEESLGLTAARLRGLRETRGDVLAYVDDDNVLAADYLANALGIMDSEEDLGALGGRVHPRYEAPPPDWIKGFESYLACRDLGGEELRTHWSEGDREYPACAPIGAGMVLRRDLMQAYAEQLSQSDLRRKLDRAGGSLSSSGDIDIGLTVLRAGWEVGYSPRLSIEHIIPASRLEYGYFQRLVHGCMVSTQLLLRELGLDDSPAVPRWKAMAKKANAWRLCRAWRSKKARLHWINQCARWDARTARRGAPAPDRGAGRERREA